MARNVDVHYCENIISQRTQVMRKLGFDSNGDLYSKV